MKLNDKARTIIVQEIQDRIKNEGFPYWYSMVVLDIKIRRYISWINVHLVYVF